MGRRSPQYQDGESALPEPSLHLRPIHALSRQEVSRTTEPQGKDSNSKKAHTHPPSGYTYLAWKIIRIGNPPNGWRMTLQTRGNCSYSSDLEGFWQQPRLFSCPTSASARSPGRQRRKSPGISWGRVCCCCGVLFF